MLKSKPGNLLMVSNYPSGTAYAWWLMEYFWKTQAQRLSENGGKAFLAYPLINTISETIANAPIKTVQLTLPWKNSDQKKQALDFIKENNISYIYFTDQPYFNIQYAEMRKSGIKTIVIHDHTPGDRPPIKGIKGLMKALRNALPLVTADYIYCVSELMRQRSLNNARIPEKKCKVIQNGINPIQCSLSKRNSIRKDLNLTENQVVVITTGRAHPYKRFDFIIASANLLFKSHPDLDIKFILVGDGPAMPDLQVQVKQLGLENKVLLLGFRNDVHTLLCAADIALHAAQGEGFSLSILEYMSAGLPVLVPDIPSVSQAIKPNINGFVFPETDSNRVAEFIYELAINKEKRQIMGNTAKNDMNTNYTLENCGRALLKAINESYDLK